MDPVTTTTHELRVSGMDCADCTENVRRAIAGVPGVVGVEVFLASERAVVAVDPGTDVLPAIQQAVARAGYTLVAADETSRLRGERAQIVQAARRRSGAALALAFAVVLSVVVLGEWLGLFRSLNARVPWPLGLAIILAFGYPVFLEVLRAARQGRIISHTLMSAGALAALLVGEWVTALVVVAFMRVGRTVEYFTAQGARRALRELADLAPQKARRLEDGQEREVAAHTLRPGDIVVVRPGEQIPVDGEVVEGRAVVDQAALTGEPMPVEVGPGSEVLAATYATGGSLRVRAARVGEESTFGKVIRLVEGAEANRPVVQQAADRFAAYYLPAVAAIAGATFLLRRDALAAAAVLVVACSCSFALATPIAMLASIGAGARRGLLIKGGRVLEALARADVLLIDKTGTLTLGRPRVTKVVPLNGFEPDQVLFLAASAERYSEHPLAEAMRSAAAERGIRLEAPQDFEALAGLGVKAVVSGRRVTVGSPKFVGFDVPPSEIGAAASAFQVAVDGQLAGVIEIGDELRPEVPEALRGLRDLGLSRIELLTGDRSGPAAQLASQLGMAFRAELLPEDKIAIAREYQARGHIVVMVGDGVNDAPALAQADVGIAMGAAGSDIAVETARAALLGDDWRLVPALFRIARRTMRVVRGNIGFTVLYNLVGLALAALGLLPPIYAAAAQSLPDLGILANSSRLLRQEG
jgi:Cd2+/Zn2+-exporting ATPase/Cu+-exporting ATPase